MFYTQMLWLLAIACYLINSVESFELNMTEYFKMPNLYDFDDYDRCLQEYENLSTYCFVRAEVLPQNDSTVWRIIKNISQYNKHHFDHHHLYFGICVRWCEQVLEHLDGNTTKELFHGILTSNEKVNTYLNLFSAEDSNRQHYNRLLNQCINQRLKTAHGLSAESVIEYCDTNKKIIEHDSWNLTFYGVICALVVLTSFSSFFDLFLKHKRTDKLLTDRDHYKAPLNGSANKICVIFSIARNWYRLNQEPVGKIGRDLRFLDCFKFFCMFLVIFAHSNWILYEGAITNPQNTESVLHTSAGTLLVTGAVITVTFFVIGGLLLTINWLSMISDKKQMSVWEYLQLFVKFNVFRYIRLTVPYAFVLLLSGVYFENPGGPLWRHILEREQLACRKNWWTNLLYINSFVNTDERCLLQSWYLAADTHSFMLSLLVLMIATRWPAIRRYLFGLVIFLSFLIPGVFVYIKNVDALFIPSLQTQKDSFIMDSHFAEFYTPFYMNFGPYFFGVLAALVYQELSLKQYRLHEQKIFQVIWYTLIPVGILLLFSAHPMFQYYEHKPSLIWRSLYAAVQRNTWGFGLGIFIVGFSAKVGWVFRKFTCLPIFRILGRLTYGAFIVHLLVLRVVIGTIRQPIYISTGMMFTFITFNMAASYLFSLILAIFIELPVSAFLKLLR